MYEAPQAKKIFRKPFSCKYCTGIRWKLGQILVGGSPGFFGGGVSFFLQGGSLIFPNRVDFTPLTPPGARLWTGTGINSYGRVLVGVFSTSFAPGMFIKGGTHLIY